MTVTTHKCLICGAVVPDVGCIHTCKPQTTLLPCPFCGGEISGVHGTQARGYYISCQNVECRANPEVEGGTPNAVIEGWNKRHAG